MAPSNYNSLLFRVAFARARPCYFYGCICLTPDERAYERRVFGLARAWGRQTNHNEASGRPTSST